MMKKLIGNFMFWSAIIPLGFNAGNGNAEPSGTVLPRGKPIKQGVSRPDAILQKVENEKGTNVDCLADFAGPMGSHGAFDKSNTHLFYMTKAEKAASGNSNRYILYDIDLIEKKAVRKAAISLPEVHYIFTHGSPVKGVSALYYGDNTINCDFGGANVVTVATEEIPDQKQQAVKSKGQYSIVDSDSHPFLFDGKKRMIVETDVSTFQTRAFAPAAVPEGDIPIYVDSRTRTFVTWRKSGKIRGLVRFEAGKETNHLKLEDSDKLSWMGGGIAVITPVDNKNSVDIQELSKDLSGKVGSKVTLSLTGPFPFKAAEISLNHAKKLALVEGASQAIKLSWRQSFLFDYKAGTEIGAAIPVAGQYIFQSTLSSDGAWLAAEQRDEKSDLTTAIKLYSVATRKWTEIKIFPPTPKKS